jgi:maleate isomerase
MRIHGITIEGLERMEAQAMGAAMRLSDADVDVIGYGCTSGSLFRGSGHHSEIEGTIRRETGIPSVATAGAVLDALNRLGSSKISVATPYTDDINALERTFLEQNNVAVIAIQGLSIVDNRKLGQKDPQVAYELAKEVYRQDAEAVFISCTNFRTIEIIDRLEKELGVPVISSNTATLWAMMKKLDITERIEGLGALYL